MACIDEQQVPKFKHYCRVCKKGFMCGRALGGHMRAHGIGDIENGSLDDDDYASDCEEKLGGSDGTSIKRMYKLRTNPNRLKSCRNCEHCGKEFLSWKSFLEHGKCGSDDTSESLVSSPEAESGEDDGGKRGGGRWSKRKRSFRAKVGSFSSTYLSSEEEDLHLARCLVQLANTRVEPPVLAEPEESCASASREEEERRNPRTFFGAITSKPPLDNKAKGPNSKRLFECKACKKVFTSHQALGGHRASHKKVKGCYAAKQEQQLDETSLGDDDVITHEDQFLIPSKPSSSFQYEQAPTVVGAAKRKSKVHECSICHRVFASGQALGGHKRCHWITSNSPDPSSLAKFHFQDKTEPIQTYPKPNNVGQSESLDLNFPSWANDMSGIRQDPRNPLSFEVSTNMHLHPWIGKDRSPRCESQQIKNNENNNVSNKINLDNNVDDNEADSSKLKSAKLSDLKDLKDMDTRGSSSQWLQVGIGSTAEASTDF